MPGRQAAGGQVCTATPGRRTTRLPGSLHPGSTSGTSRAHTRPLHLNDHDSKAEVLIMRQRAQPSQPESAGSVQTGLSGQPLPDVLADADWVQAHLDDPSVVPVEITEDASAYDQGHIKGAVKLDWKQDLQDPRTRGFIDRAGFEALLSRRGIANHDTVILYSGEQQLMRRLRALVLQGLRAPRRQAARRRPEAVGTRLPRDGDRGAAPSRDGVPIAETRTVDPDGHPRQEPGHLVAAPAPLALAGSQYATGGSWPGTESAISGSAAETHRRRMIAWQLTLANCARPRAVDGRR